MFSVETHKPHGCPFHARCLLAEPGAHAHARSLPIAFGRSRPPRARRTGGRRRGRGPGGDARAARTGPAPCAAGAMLWGPTAGRVWLQVWARRPGGGTMRASDVMHAWKSVFLPVISVLVGRAGANSSRTTINCIESIVRTAGAITHGSMQCSHRTMDFVVHLLVVSGPVGRWSSKPYKLHVDA